MRATHLVRWLAVLAASTAILWACGPGAGTAVLDVTVTPKAIDDKGQVADVKVVATDSQGRIGAGSVTVKSTAGSLFDGETVTLDAYGTGTTTFSCDVSQDVDCFGSVTVSGTWTVDGLTVKGEQRVTVGSGSGGGTGTGGGTGSGGGAGTGGGSPATDTVLVLGPIGGTGVGIAPVTAPTQVRIGLPASLLVVAIRANGSIVYLRDQPVILYEFQPDTWKQSGTGSAFPNAEANDIKVDNVCGTTNAPYGLANLWTRPDSNNYVYQCGLNNNLRFEATTPHTEWDGFGLIALGYGKAALLQQSQSAGGHVVILDKEGTAVTTTLNSADRKLVKARNDGFWFQGFDGTNCVLRHLAFDGTITDVGTQAALPSDVTVAASCRGVLDNNGALFSIGTRNGKTVVVKQPLLPGTSDVVYNTESLPTTDYSVFPPSGVWVSPSFLVSTP